MSTDAPKSEARHSRPVSLFARAERLSLPTSDKQQTAMRRGMNAMMYHWLGAHLVTEEGQTGTRFSVWAPNAREVCVLLDRNHWQHGGFYLNSSDSGVWSGFVPEVGSGEVYKYSIRTQTGELIQKMDPVGFYCETPPKTASIVWNLNEYEWNDAAWLEQRAQTNLLNAPVSVYEVHLGSWRRPRDGRRYFTYGELADQLIEYMQEMGYTHLQLMPITEYPFDGSWGYQTTGYFAPTSRYGSPQDFMAFVDAFHQAGIGVFLDWVPGHFPTDGHALGKFDGTSLYEHADPRQGFHPDWNTNIFNYGRMEVRNFLLSSARFWCDVYHLDGLRVDAVASMLYLDYSRNEGEWSPNAYGGRENLDAVQFLQEMNATVYKREPGAFTVAEESTAWPGVTRATHLGGLGFGLKWNMGWMHDSLDYVSREPIHRQWHHNEMTFALVYAWSENYVLPISHDEVVHGKGSLLSKMPGDHWQKRANLRAFLAYMWAHPGKQLLFMGQEFGQESEWSEGRSLDWWLMDQPDHEALSRLVCDLNAEYRAHPALWSLDVDPGGFEWIDANDAGGNTFSWIRRSDSGELLVCVVNFSAVPHFDYRIGLPEGGRWREVLNTDAHEYGGSGVGNFGGVDADDWEWHGRPFSASISVPPLGAVWLTPS